MILTNERSTGFPAISISRKRILVQVSKAIRSTKCLRKNSNHCPILWGSFHKKDRIRVFLRHLLQSLLDEPNPNSPANNMAAKMYQENRREYEKKVKVVVEESWAYCGEIPSD